MKYIRKAALYMKSTKQTKTYKKMKKEKRNRRKPGSKSITKEKGAKKRRREALVMSPHARDQSNRVPLKEASDLRNHPSPSPQKSADSTPFKDTIVRTTKLNSKY